MSRQFDELMVNRFEVNGAEYDLIEPTSIEELSDALRLKDMIASLDANIFPNFEEILCTQDSYISEYVENLDDFDNDCMNQNISYLLKKHSLRMGELEGLLGLSAGYISRTMNENSGKKMSIDTAYKIAEFFNVEFEKFIDVYLEEPQNNNELASAFIEKLLRQTKDNDIQWENIGGNKIYSDIRLLKSGVITKSDDDGKFEIYNNINAVGTKNFPLTDNIYSCSDLDQKNDLIIVSYSYGEGDTVYDYLLISKSTTLPSAKTIFSTLFCGDSWIIDDTKDLLELIHNRERDIHISTEMKKFIRNYIN